MHGPVESFMRFQAESSSLCYLVAVTNAIYYNMSLQSKIERYDVIQKYAINISQYQRNRFTHDQIFRTIFLGEGGDPIDLLTDLLQPANPSIHPRNITRSVCIEVEYFPNIEAMYTMVTTTIQKYGALIIEAFKIFPDMIAADHEVTFGGDFNLKTQFGTDQNINYTMLVVGARLTGLETDVMGGMEFLVQTSWKNKPFLIIGYDLLRSMGVTELYAIQNGLSFLAHPPGEGVDGGTITLECGSPRKTLQFEDNDNSGIEVPAEDFFKNRRWGISNEPRGSKKDEEESVVNAPVDEIPSYWMQFDPKTISYILT
jgi:hypothetical protein